MSVPLLIAGALASVAAVVHGAGGELLVLRKLSSATLPVSPFGGGAATKTMLRVSWHVATIAFVVVAVSLTFAGSARQGASAHAVGLVGASAATAYAALLVGTAVVHGATGLVRHPGPAMFGAIAGLAWWGLLG